MKSKQPIIFISLLFFLSGAIALSYEILWIKTLGLYFGHSAWSISTVVAAFMFGLGLGSLGAGELSTKISRPIRIYGYLEIAIAIFALFSYLLFQYLDKLIIYFYHALPAYQSIYFLVRFLTTFLFLVIPTFMMGATLPILVAGFSKSSTFQRWIGFFYGINTLGAALGVLSVSFFFLPKFGIVSSIHILVIINFLIGIFALIIDRQVGYVIAVNKDKRKLGIKSWIGNNQIFLYFLAFFSGLASLSSEIGWTRLLAPILGSSTHAFAIILFSFLIGIGGGSLLVSRCSLEKHWKYLMITLLGTAVSLIVTLYGFNWFPTILQMLTPFSSMGLGALFISQGLVTAALILIPTLFMGATLPLIITCYKNLNQSSGQSVGRLYLLNTLGSTAGALLAGFTILPNFGIQINFVLAGLVLFLLSMGTLIKLNYFSFKKIASFVVVSSAIYILLLIFFPKFDFQTLQLGHFRVLGQTIKPIGESRPHLVYLKEGRIETVAIYRTPDTTNLFINGKPDASTTGDLDTQYMIGHLPLFLHENPKKVFVIGYGSGSTIRAIAAHPVEEIYVTELEPVIMETDPYFYVVNDRVLFDNRVNVYIEDGRTFLRYNQKKYDVIVSQPSNPWIEGVSSVFTRDFYEIIQDRLLPNGILCQWIQTYEVSDETLSVMLRTLGDVFPHIEILTIDGDLILLASLSPLEGNFHQLANRFKDPNVKQTLERIDIKNPFELFLGYIYSFPADAGLFETEFRNTDENLWLESRASIDMYTGAKPNFAPLALERYLPRYQKKFYGDLSEAEVALGLSRAVARLRPYAGQRIKAFLNEVKTSKVKGLLMSALLEADKNWSLKQDSTQKFEKTLDLFKQNKYMEAKNTVKILHEREPNNPIYLRMLGLALEETGDPEGALKSYEKAIEINPNDYFSHLKCEKLLVMKGEEDKARQHEFIARKLLEKNY